MSSRHTLILLRRAATRAFTMMELMVAVALLVMVILAVGMIFRSASAAVGLSQVSMEVFSNVRAMQQQLERDVAGLDRNGFLVIRSRNVNGRRFDLLTFLAHGQFPNRTGTDGSNASGGNPFADRTTADAARITYGHLYVEDFPQTFTDGNPPQTPASGTPNQSAQLPSNALPTGIKDQDFVLGRSALLLMASTGGVANNPNRLAVPAGSSGVYVLPVFAGEVTNADQSSPAAIDAMIPAANMPFSEPDTSITSSRVNAVTLTPAQLMQQIMAVVVPNSRANFPRYEADAFCFRAKTLSTPYASSVSMINGAFRMHPILLQACPHFQVDWTDGTMNNGQLIWRGLDSRAGDATVEPAPANGDDYTALFSFDSRAKWPKALRVTYRVTDTGDRLNGGRTFTQVLRLPN